MAIYNDIEGVNTISSTSTQGIISTANKNFKLLVNALRDFLNEIGYSEDEISMSLKKFISKEIELNGTMNVNNDKGTAISLDANGKINAKGSIKSEMFVQTPMLYLDHQRELPSTNTGGQIVYARNSEGKFDFFGYVNDRGWLSLTEGGGVAPMPSEDIRNLDSWSSSVESIITEIPETPQPGSPETKYRYVISGNATGELAEHAGEVLYWSSKNGKWEYATPEDGAFVVVKDEGNIIYVANVDGSDIQWERAYVSEKLGVDTEGLNRFSKDDTIAWCISLIDNELLDIYHEALAAFCHTQGIAYTNVDWYYTPSKNYTDADSIYADDVASNSEQVQLQLTPVPGSDGYSFRINPNEVRTLLSPAYGSQFEGKVYSGGTPMANDYIIEYNSGVVVFKYKPESTPTYLKAYKYTGEFLSDKLGTSIVLNPNKNMHVSISTPNMNYIGTGLKTDIDYRGFIAVTVNGVNVTVCDGSGEKGAFDCYFSNDGGINAVSYINKVVPKNTELYWNSLKSGYILETDDVIEFFYI